MPLSIVENPWLWHFVMFPSHKELVQKHISIMLCKKMEMHVLSTIAKCAMTIATFDF
jgi:hypothetical protein